jgi:hypothetical protein
MQVDGLHLRFLSAATNGICPRRSSAGEDVVACHVKAELPTLQEALSVRILGVR